MGILSSLFGNRQSGIAKQSTQNEPWSYELFKMQTTYSPTIFFNAYDSMIQKLNEYVERFDSDGLPLSENSPSVLLNQMLSDEWKTERVNGFIDRRWGDVLETIGELKTQQGKDNQFARFYNEMKSCDGRMPDSCRKHYLELVKPYLKESPGEKALKKLSPDEMQRFMPRLKASTIYDIGERFIMLISPEDYHYVRKDIERLNELIRSSYQLWSAPVALQVDVSEIRFDTFVAEHLYTHIECSPYTKTGRIAKTPFTIRYACSKHYNSPKNDSFGTLNYDQRGQLRGAKMIFWKNHKGRVVHVRQSANNTLFVQKIEALNGTGRSDVIYKGVEA